MQERKFPIGTKLTQRKLGLFWLPIWQKKTPERWRAHPRQYRKEKATNLRGDLTDRAPFAQVWRWLMSNPSINRFEWLKAVMQAEVLTPTAKNVATALAVQFANAETGQINPSQETLGGLSSRCIAIP